MKRSLLSNKECHPSAQHPSRPTDSELADRVQRYLYQRLPDCDLLTVEVVGGTVILRGEVPSRSVKRLCLESCQRVAGVVHLIDELDVVEPHWRPPPK